jgi:tRNA pseudouridine38-40 synthase
MNPPTASRLFSSREMLVKIIVEYDGSDYCGWQMQSGQPSIQAAIEQAIERIAAAKVRVRAAGRTDAGVHARGQVAVFSLPRPFEPADLMRALNALLPPEIAVLETAMVHDSFDPRRDACSRVYEYRVLNQSVRSVFEFRYAWLVREPLELDRMNEAAGVFLGEHDFAALRSLGSGEKSTIRRVLTSEWRRDGALLTYRVEATAFLRHMVRTMVAAMVDVGRGATTARDIAQLLASRDRALAPAPAPARGLCLVEVRYESEPARIKIVAQTPRAGNS